MKRFITNFVACALALSSTAFAAEEQLLAFPGAEGFGRYTTGGRGGEIYHVTNLNDSGTGSLRDALSQSNRIIVFDVAGTINLKDALIFKSNQTILGQTAPGEGIQLYGNRVSFSNANNLIVRHLRIRMGIGGPSGKDAAGAASGHDMIFDHLSVLWGRDENFSISSNDKSGGPQNITIQNSIIGQGLQSHSCGGLIQSDNGVTLYRNLYIENKTRNPKVKGLNQYVNNVVYNWGGGGCYIMSGSEGDSWADIENNYFMHGPWNGSTKPFTRGTPTFCYYGAGNFYDNDKDGTINGHEMTLDEMKGESSEGISPYSTWYESLAALNAHITEHNSAKGTSIQQIPEISNKMTALEALNWVAENVGPVLPVRDDVDQYLIDELTSWGTTGTKNGITTERTLPHGGTGIISGGVKPTDSDGDGIPDAWEIANGLNPNDASDAKAIAANGYANIENYSFTITEAYPYIKKPVSLKVAKQKKNSIELSWDLNKNTTNGFIIEAKKGNSEFAEAMRVAANTTVAEVAGLDPNTEYSFRVRSFNNDGIYSDYTDVALTETIGDPIVPYVSTNPFPADGGKEGIANGLTLTWENTMKNYYGDVVYTVYLGTDAENLAAVSENQKEKSYKTVGLEAGKTYYWRVDAKNDVGVTASPVWSFSTTAGGVLFYTDFYQQPQAWYEKYGSIGDNTNVCNSANAKVEIGGMTIGCGDDAIRIIAMSGANNSADGSQDYGPATAEDAGASNRCLQFYTTKAGGYVMTPTITGPCVVTIYAGNPDKSSKTFKLNTVVNGEETTVADLQLGAAKRVYKFEYTYMQSGNVQFKIDANGKKININDILVERYIPSGGGQALELTAGDLVVNNMSYADGSLQYTFNQDVIYNGGAVVTGGEQYEKFQISASGKKLTINYMALNVNTDYTIAFGNGAVTTVDKSQSFLAEVKFNTCDFPELKASGETHYGKAAARLPLNFVPFTAVAPFETEGGLVQDKQNDYPHWVQASGSIDDNEVVMTSTADKLMCYYGPSAKSVLLKAEIEGTALLKLQESRNCDNAPGWRTLRTFTEADSPIAYITPLNPESHFVKVTAPTLSGKVKVTALALSDDDGVFSDDIDMSGITLVEAGVMAYQVNGGVLTVIGARSGSLVNVYDVTGRLLASKVAADTVVEFELNPGIVILSVNGESVKVKI